MLDPTTATKRDEDAKARLVAIVESSDDAIVSKNLDGIITSWNRGAESIFGYSAQEVIGQPVTILIPEDRANEEPSILRRIRAGEKIEHYETIRRRKDGTLLNISLTVSPIVDAAGRVVGASKIARDITERKRSEEALREAQRHFQQWNNQLEQAVGMKTVELRHSQERLRALTNELNVTEQRERKRLATELHDHLQQMLVLAKIKLGQGKRLVTTVPAALALMNELNEIFSDALQYTRVLVTELSPPVLRDHGLAAGLKWLGEYMQKHDITVTVTVHEGALKLPENHVVFLFQCVRELLINSSKHAGTGQASVMMDHRDSVLTIRVRDEGAGFDPTMVNGRETSSGEMSSKFGLFSIGERMLAIGGSFDIHSVPGKGTTAMLNLPLAKRLDQHAMKVGTDSGGSTTSRQELRVSTSITRVLLVDDHLMVRQGLKAILNAYDDIELVGEAGDGEEAVRLVDQLLPAVVVMDLDLPKLDGIEATRQIKCRHPETIIIGLSVNPTKESDEAMKRAGAARLLTKEAAVERLYESIVEIRNPQYTGDESHSEP